MVLATRSAQTKRDNATQMVCQLRAGPAGRLTRGHRRPGETFCPPIRVPSAWSKPAPTRQPTSSWRRRSARYGGPQCASAALTAPRACAQTVNIQCFVRQCFAWRRIERLRFQRQEQILETTRAQQALEAQSEELRTKEIVRAARLAPRRAAPSHLLVTRSAPTRHAACAISLTM